MFIREHAPPHFHAEHQGQYAAFTLDGHLLAGSLRSAKARSRIQLWARMHVFELHANWSRIEASRPPEAIEPLE